MNDLEQWLADVKAYNESAGFFAAQFGDVMARRAVIEGRGKHIGLKLSKIKSMLASVKLKVEMPVEDDAPKA